MQNLYLLYCLQNSQSKQVLLFWYGLYSGAPVLFPERNKFPVWYQSDKSYKEVLQETSFLNKLATVKWQK